ncbi:hypothetical protein ACHAPJ_001032 [Fusarium lateritium]
MSVSVTAKKFIGWNGGRFYRTGVLARRSQDGQPVWAGRADSMIKNRGFLVNLGTEVELVLAPFDAVRAAVAFTWRERLVGYVQPANVNIDELRQVMRERYDPFVILDIILALDSFPLGLVSPWTQFFLRPNGKTDRGALKEQLDESQSETHQLVNSEQELDSAYDILRTALPQILRIPIEQLDETSAFTKKGGNSLTALQLTSLLNKKEYLVSVVGILKLDTIGRL